ncbi:MAG: urea transporter [Deltaproteobacteria bacterium]|nr:urea transporter [Deltaproteobacteria bacterium]
MFDFNSTENASSKDPGVGFIDSLLKGMAQILFCSSPLSGLLFLIATFILSTKAGLLCILGLIITTTCAHFFKYNKVLIAEGFYSYNGALLGILWLYLDDITVPSFILFILSCVLVVFFQHFFINSMFKRGQILPTLSIGSMFMVWLALIVSYAFGLISYPLDIEPLEISPISFFQNPDYEFMGQYLLEYSGALILCALGIFYNSHLSCLMAMISFFVTIPIAIFLAGNSSLYWHNLFFNIIPLSIAVGGIYFKFNLSSLLYSFFGILLVVLVLFFAHHYLRILGLPVMLAPLNIVIYLLYAPFLKGLKLEKTLKLYRIPLPVGHTPESILQWSANRELSDKYWHTLFKKTS